MRYCCTVVLLWKKLKQLRIIIASVVTPAGARRALEQYRSRADDA